MTTWKRYSIVSFCSLLSGTLGFLLVDIARRNYNLVTQLGIEYIFSVVVIFNGFYLLVPLFMLLVTSIKMKKVPPLLYCVLVPCIYLFVLMVFWYKKAWVAYGAFPSGMVFGKYYLIVPMLMFGWAFWKASSYIGPNQRLHQIGAKNAPPGEA